MNQKNLTPQAIHRKIKKNQRTRLTQSRQVRHKHNRALVNKSELILVTDDIRDFINNSFFKEKYEERKSILITNKNIVCRAKRWNIFVQTAYKDYRIMQSNMWNGLIISDDSILEYNNNSNSIRLSLYGSDQKLLNIALAAYDEVGIEIEWVYTADGQSISVPLNIDRLPCKEMYPFLQGDSLESYYEGFIKSNSNILILIGAPGTGKTSFIRGLLQYTGTDALLSYDPEILSRDGIFARFLEDDSGMMIMEDSDNFLRARSDGNSMMARFLNVGDGLVSTKGKKLVFSTNLPSIQDIDDALLRPGRCYDVLNFQKLTQSEADILADKFDIEIGEQKTWTIAEVFNEKEEERTIKSNVRTMGFY